MREMPEDFEIGRILHFKSGISKFRIGPEPSPSNLRFRITDLKCRIRPISNFSFPLVSCFLIIFLLSACSIGSKYKTPAAPVPPAFKEPPPANFKEDGEWKQAAPQDDTIRGNWWEIFGDPQLNDLEAQVNISNQTIAAAEAQFRGARAAVHAARS